MVLGDRRRDGAHVQLLARYLFHPQRGGVGASLGIELIALDTNPSVSFHLTMSRRWSKSPLHWHSAESDTFSLLS